MGYAVPAAMAARLAAPSRTVVAVCGDGGFAMSIHALMTAVQEDLPIGVLVLNNGALGWVLHGMGEKAVAAHFAEFDHAGIARSHRMPGDPDFKRRRPARCIEAPPGSDGARGHRRADIVGDIVHGCRPEADRG